MSSPLVTGLMAQYQQLKSQVKDALLFFRLGDFYELFYDDALLASKLLGITLTQRTGVPMCGVPHHASEAYITKLVNLGYKVGLAEQISKPLRGLAERAIVEIITPGTAISRGQNPENYDENFLLAAYTYKEFCSVALLDVTRGVFLMQLLAIERAESVLINELNRKRVNEVVIAADFMEKFPKLAQAIREKKLLINQVEDWHFDNPRAKEALQEQFSTVSLSGFGLEGFEAYLGVPVTLLEYAKAQLQQPLTHIKTLKLEQQHAHVWLDDSSFKNLEILANAQDGGEQYSLFSILNTTQTAMGRRYLRQIISQPTKNLSIINDRLDRIERFTKDLPAIRSVQAELKQMQDLERLLTKVMLKRAHAKDLLGIGRTLQHIAMVCNFSIDYLPLNEQLIAIADHLSNEIMQKIDAQAPLDFQTGGIIARGWHQELDYLHGLSDNSQAKLEEYAQQEREQTGVALRLKENRQIGWFFEVNKNYAASLPSYFERCGSVVNGERYVTKRLKELELEIANADERIIMLEQELFYEIQNLVAEYFNQIKDIIDFISQLDSVVALARVAVEFNYVRPMMGDGFAFEIKEARHPVVERAKKEQFVANDVTFSPAKSLLITGPNMAGKSTYLRMTALISYMAHIGSFVPASSAIMPIQDCIFCRVGASDNLARGQSTFLVEMSETARILQYASAKSLVIVDEVGRGTSSDDGLALARAIFQYLTQHIQSYTLFATHYHELTQMPMLGYANYSLKVIEADGRIYFTNELINEAASDSYGIYVAKMAGLPAWVIESAQQFLLDNSLGQVKKVKEHNQHKSKPELFSSQELWQEQILAFDINNKTPLEALALLGKIQKELKK